jgi:hypothetical protein
VNGQNLIKHSTFRLNTSEDQVDWNVRVSLSSIHHACEVRYYVDLPLPNIFATRGDGLQLTLSLSIALEYSVRLLAPRQTLSTCVVSIRLDRRYSHAACAALR